MSQALHTSSTGINAGQQQIDVIANNVANINTTGYKTANVTFETLYSNTLSHGSAATKEGGGTNPQQIGLGTKVSGITRNFESGSFISTGRDMDLMISGTGFFVVQDSAGAQYFTRDGIFTTDSDGNLVTQSGMKVVGATSPYSDTSSSTTVKIPTILESNVVSTAKDKIASKKISDLNNVMLSKGDFTITVLDSNGVAVGSPATLSITDLNATLGDLVKSFNTAINNSDINGYVTTSVIDGGLEFTPKTGYTLSFDAINTNFLAQTGINNSNYIANDMNESVTLQDMLSYSSYNNISLSSATIDENGIVSATYSDGSTLTTTINDNGAAVWKYKTNDGVQIEGTDVTTKGSIQTDSNFIIELATMVNQEGLESISNNLWKWAPDVGEIYYGMAGEMSFGAIESGGYESSNVDMATELSNMISAQRMIQMNSRVFSTASSVMETLAYLGQ